MDDWRAVGVNSVDEEEEEEVGEEEGDVEGHLRDSRPCRRRHHWS